MDASTRWQTWSDCCEGVGKVVSDGWVPRDVAEAFEDISTKMPEMTHKVKEGRRLFALETLAGLFVTQGKSSSKPFHDQVAKLKTFVNKELYVADELLPANLQEKIKKGMKPPKAKKSGVKAEPEEARQEEARPEVEAPRRGEAPARATNTSVSGRKRL